MKLETIAGQLHDALKAVGLVVERRNTIPILGCVLIKKNTVIGTNLDMQVSMRFAASHASGSCAVDFAQLFGLVGAIPRTETVTIESHAKPATLTLTWTHGRYWLSYQDPSDFPGFDEPDAWHGPHAAGNWGLVEAIKTARTAVSKEETRYYLNGVYLDPGEGRRDPPRVVATDGHRMITVEVPGAQGFGGQILPREACAIIAALGEPQRVALCDTQVRFDYAGGAFVTKLIDGTYPKWRRIIPHRDENYGRLKLDPGEWRAAMRRLGHATPARQVHVSLRLGSDTVWITGGHDLSSAAGCERLPAAKWTAGGDKVSEIGVNPAYVQDMLRAVGPSVDIFCRAPEDPMVCFGDGVTCLLMPTRRSTDTKTLDDMCAQVGS